MPRCYSGVHEEVKRGLICRPYSLTRRGYMTRPACPPLPPADTTAKHGVARAIERAAPRPTKGRGGRRQRARTGKHTLQTKGGAGHGHGARLCYPSTQQSAATDAVPPGRVACVGGARTRAATAPPHTYRRTAATGRGTAAGGPPFARRGGAGRGQGACTPSSYLRAQQGGQRAPAAAAHPLGRGPQKPCSMINDAS